jgi:hypothetical protein
MTLIIEGRTEDLQLTWRERLLSLDLSINCQILLSCMHVMCASNARRFFGFISKIMWLLKLLLTSN